MHELHDPSFPYDPRDHGQEYEPLPFTPPRCPNQECSAHFDPPPKFFWRKGSYRAKCRYHPVKRFQCRICFRGFSRQTFRQDYCDNKPWLNRKLYRDLASGLGLRETGRRIGMTYRNTVLKFRKVAIHCAFAHRNNLFGLPRDGKYQMDEMIDYETERVIRPISLPALVESRSFFFLDSLSAPIRPSGKETEHKTARIAELEAIEGPRIDRSNAAVMRGLRRLARALRDPRDPPDPPDEAEPLGTATLITDKRPSYKPLAKRALVGVDYVHLQVKGDAERRDTRCTLFPIHHTQALLRCRVGRLRRESWLKSKRRRWLDIHIALYATFRNYVRPRFNRDVATPAQILGIMPRPLTEEEVLGWRQDWGPDRAPHLLSNGEFTVREGRGRAA